MSDGNWRKCVMRHLLDCRTDGGQATNGTVWVMNKDWFMELRDILPPNAWRKSTEDKYGQKHFRLFGIPIEITGDTLPTLLDKECIW